jgi:hypothetical protein
MTKMFVLDEKEGNGSKCQFCDVKDKTGRKEVVAGCEPLVYSHADHQQHDLCNRDGRELCNLRSGFQDLPIQDHDNATKGTFCVFGFTGFTRNETENLLVT